MKQTTQIAEVRLVYTTNIKASERTQVKTSQDAYELFLGRWFLNRYLIDYGNSYAYTVVRGEEKEMAFTRQIKTDKE